MLVSRDWLRRRINADPDLDADADVPIETLASLNMLLAEGLSEDPNAHQLIRAFGVLVRELRRRQQLSIEDLAAKARVPADELWDVEQNPHFIPRPQFIQHLAIVLDVPARALAILANVSAARDDQFEQKTLQFLSIFDDHKLATRRKQRALGRYVEFLVKCGC